MEGHRHLLISVRWCQRQLVRAALGFTRCRNENTFLFLNRYFEPRYRSCPAVPFGADGVCGCRWWQTRAAVNARKSCMGLLGIAHLCPIPRLVVRGDGGSSVMLQSRHILCPSSPAEPDQGPGGLSGAQQSPSPCSGARWSCRNLTGNHKQQFATRPLPGCGAGCAAGPQGHWLGMGLPWSPPSASS